MRAVSAVCENGNAVASLRENGDEIIGHEHGIVNDNYVSSANDL